VDVLERRSQPVFACHKEMVAEKSGSEPYFRNAKLKEIGL
jgi:hypothetical protein